jgi:hypothetical protein
VLRQSDPIDEDFFTGSEEINLRGDRGDQRTLAEWLADERPLPGEAGETRTGSSASAIAQAQRAAERAVNEGAVPRQYHDFIQRYFGRLRQTIDKAAEEDTEKPEA